MKTEVMFSSKSDEYETPHDVFNELDAEFHFNLDPCSTDENHKCPLWFTKEQNGLQKNWGGDASVLQSTIQQHIGMGEKVLSGKHKRRNASSDADTCENGHEILPRLHSAQVGDTIYQGQIEIWITEKQCTVSVNDSYFQSSKS